MQTLLKGLHWGLGSGMGALVGGYTYDNYGAVRLFEFSALLSCFSFVLSFYMIQKTVHRPELQPQSVHPDNSSYIEMTTNPVIPDNEEA